MPLLIVTLSPAGPICIPANLIAPPHCLRACIPARAYVRACVRARAQEIASKFPSGSEPWTGARACARFTVLQRTSSWQSSR